ncbi:Myb family transcription factor APL [Senna tora]|uniref:Myb family transcription factor APL n=1 Tax=Senna tora TaxID=362788 RepID=A0A834T0U7_9FABA|nr:Myb family transcription factor APL [Senna tora]
MLASLQIKGVITIESKFSILFLAPPGDPSRVIPPRLSSDVRQLSVEQSALGGGWKLGCTFETCTPATTVDGTEQKLKGSNIEELLDGPYPFTLAEEKEDIENVFGWLGGDRESLLATKTSKCRNLRVMERKFITPQEALLKIYGIYNSVAEAFRLKHNFQFAAEAEYIQQYSNSIETIPRRDWVICVCCTKKCSMNGTKFRISAIIYLDGCNVLEICYWIRSGERKDQGILQVVRRCLQVVKENGVKFNPVSCCIIVWRKYMVNLISGGGGWGHNVHLQVLGRDIESISSSFLLVLRCIAHQEKQLHKHYTNPIHKARRSSNSKLTTGAPKLSDSINESFVKVSRPTKTRFGISRQYKTRVSQMTVVQPTLHIFLRNRPFVRVY